MGLVKLKRVWPTGSYTWGNNISSFSKDGSSFSIGDIEIQRGNGWKPEDPAVTVEVIKEIVVTEDVSGQKSVKLINDQGFDPLE